MKNTFKQHVLAPLITMAFVSSICAMEDSCKEQSISEDLTHLSEFNASLQNYEKLMKKCEEVDQKRKNVESRSHEKIRSVLLMSSEEAKGLAYKLAEKMDTKSNEKSKLAALRVNKNDPSLQGVIKELNKERNCHSEFLQRLEEKLMTCEDESSKKKYFASYNMTPTYYPTYKNETTLEIGHYLFFRIIESYSLQKGAQYEKFLRDAQIKIEAEQPK